jgi:hypothetical protein
LFILPEALMSDTSQTIPVHPPSNPNRTVDRDGFRASFYPGFVRRLSVWSEGGSNTVLYEQPLEGPDSRFFLPPGYTRPWACSTVEFSRPDGRRLVLQVEDPHQQIDRIEVYLKGDAAASPKEAQVEVSGTVKLPRLVGEDPPPPVPPAGGGVVLVVEDGPVLCPPACPEIG